LKNEITHRKLRVKAILCACLLALCVSAGAFAAVVRPSDAAQIGAQAVIGAHAVFTRRYDSNFASVGALEVRDPFTGRSFTVPAGLAMLFADSNAGVHAYCIQKGQEIFDTGGVTRRAYSLADPMFSRLSAAAKENIALAALFGYPNRTAAQLNADQATAHAATQLLLWESQLGYRSAAFVLTDSRVANAYFTGGANAEVKAVYEAIALRIQEFLRVPSFLQSEPLMLALTYDESSGLYAQRFTDTNGSNAELAVVEQGIAVRREGPDYIFSSASLPARETQVTIERTDIPSARVNELGPPLIWVDPACGAENQLLFSGVDSRERRWRACLRPGEEEFTTTAGYTTICATTTGIIPSSTCPATTERATSACTTADCTTTPEKSTAATTTTRSPTTKCPTTTVCPTTTTRPATLCPTTLCPTTLCPTTASATSRPATQGAAQTSRAVTPPPTGEPRTAGAAAMLLCMGALGAYLARRGKEEGGEG